MRFLINIIIISLFFSAARADETQQQEIVDLLKHVELKKREQDRLDKFGKQSVLIPALLLEQNRLDLDSAKTIAILVRQYQRHLEFLSESERQGRQKMPVPL